jgi:hypothetical protein
VSGVCLASCRAVCFPALVKILAENIWGRFLVVIIFVDLLIVVVVFFFLINNFSFVSAIPVGPSDLLVGSWNRTW